MEIWATLKALGREGVGALVEDLCDKAAYFAKGLEENGFVIFNEVVFNQILVSCGSPGATAATLESVQQSGVCWCGGAVWKNETVIRISVCSYMTTRVDIDRCVHAFVGACGSFGG